MEFALYGLLAAISGEALISALIWIVGIGLICWLLWWFIGYVGLPEPFAKVARALIALVAVILLVRLILKMTGNPEF